jgi:hypothetical protein
MVDSGSGSAPEALPDTDPALGLEPDWPPACVSPSPNVPQPVSNNTAQHKTSPMTADRSRLGRELVGMSSDSISL